MSDNKRYVLDASVFIEAHQKYYAFDICHGFWVAIVRRYNDKRLFSIDKVKTELVGGDDWLNRWARDKALAPFFKQTADRAVLDAFKAMVNWVQAEPQFDVDAKAQFAAVADGWVIAYAKASGMVVVTHEEYAPDARKKVPMPNVCLKFDVPYCNTFAMLRDLNVKFGLKKRKGPS